MTYGPQIVPGNGSCQYCGRTDRPLQRHEVYHGPFREKSKQLGAWVQICDECHRQLHQKDASIDMELKIWMQGNVMAKYGWTVERFRLEFGKNYEWRKDEQVRSKKSNRRRNEV